MIMKIEQYVTKPKCSTALEYEEITSTFAFISGNVSVSYTLQHSVQLVCMQCLGLHRKLWGRKKNGDVNHKVKVKFTLCLPMNHAIKMCPVTKHHAIRRMGKWRYNSIHS
jgi:hypothetical protein